MSLKLDEEMEWHVRVIDGRSLEGTSGFGGGFEFGILEMR